MKRLRFQSKIFIFSCLISILTFLLLSSIFTFFVLTNVTENRIKENQIYAQRVALQTNELLRQMDIAASYGMLHKDLQGVLKSIVFNGQTTSYDQYNYRQMVYGTLQQIGQSCPRASRVLLYNIEKDFFFYSGLYADSPAAGHAQYRAWYRELFAPGIKTVYACPVVDQWDNSNRSTISLYKNIQSIYGVHYATLEIQVPYAELQTICQATSPDSQIVILDQQGKLVYPLELDEATVEAYRVLSATPPPSAALEALRAPANAIYSVEAIPKSEWTVVVGLPKSSLFSSFWKLFAVIALLCTLIILIAVTLFYLLSRKLAVPVNSIAHKYLDRAPTNTTLLLSNDEFEQLDYFIEEITTRLRDTVSKMYDIKLEQMNAQFNALQAKMNPHFMYNALNAISAAGLLHGPDAVAEMCSQLADILRYSSASDAGMVTMEEEIRHVEEYLRFMKASYEEDLVYSVSLSQEAAKLPIPPLTLQPLIENCFSHAFCNCPAPWRVDVRVHCDQSHWYAEVRDNGDGFSPQQTERFRARSAACLQQLHNGEPLEQLHISGMGLLSSYARLCILADGQLSLTIEPNTPQGSIVKLQCIHHLREDISYAKRHRSGGSVTDCQEHCEDH